MTNKERKLKLRKVRRKVRSRAKIEKRADRPRLHVFRSLKAISAQIIDDTVGKTLVSAYAHEIAVGKKSKNTEQAQAVGALLAERAKQKGIRAVVFDRSGNAFHGRVKALAEAARAGGLEF